MDMHIKLWPDFEKAFQELLDKYGEPLAKLNGFSDSQLSYTDFIDNFVDKAVVADASIDGNANVGHKDVVALENEMSKPHSKLLGFSKIFYELQKKYGLETARQWLETEWTGGFYLHDAYNTSLKPYCFRGDTKIKTDLGDMALKDLVGKSFKVIGALAEWENATAKYFGRDVMYKLVVRRMNLDDLKIEERTIYTTANHKWFVCDTDEQGSANYIVLLKQTSELSPDDVLYTMNDNSWYVVSVENTGIEDDVYCAVVPTTHAFTLDCGILTHNCFAYDIEDVVTKGLFFINDFNNQPPKHLVTFTDFVCEYISWACNRSSGKRNTVPVCAFAGYHRGTLAAC